MKGGTEMFLVKQAQRGDADAFVALSKNIKWISTKSQKPV